MKALALANALMLAGLVAAQIDASGNGDDGAVVVVKRQEIVKITPAPSLNLTDEEIAQLGDPGDLRRIDRRQGSGEPVIADITPAPPLNLTDEEIAQLGDPGDLRRIDRRQDAVKLAAPPAASATDSSTAEIGPDSRRISRRADGEGDEEEEDDEDDDDDDDDDERDAPRIGGGRSSKREEAAAEDEEDEEGSDDDREHPQIGGGRGSRRRRAQDDDGHEQTVDVGDLAGGATNSTDPGLVEGGDTRRIGRGGRGEVVRRQDTQTVDVGELTGGEAGNSTDPSQLEGSQTRRIGWPRQEAGSGGQSAAAAGKRVGGHRGGRLPIGRSMRYGRRNEA